MARTKEEIIEELEYTFEYIVEKIDGSYGPSLEFEEVPCIKYLIDQIVDETGADRTKVVEGFERWASGIRRKYG